MYYVMLRTLSHQEKEDHNSKRGRIASQQIPFCISAPIAVSIKRNKEEESDDVLYTRYKLIIKSV